MLFLWTSSSKLLKTYAVCNDWPEPLRRHWMVSLPSICLFAFISFPLPYLNQV